MNRFQPLKPADYPFLKKYFRGQKYSLSIYSLPSLIAWSSDVSQTSYTIRDGRLVMAGESLIHPDNRHLILPLSLDSEVKPDELYQLARSLNYQEYRFIPEDYLANYDRSDVGKFFEIFEQPEYEDYIYLVDDLVNLNGRRFAKKRNHLHYFHNEYIAQGRVVIEYLTPENKDECLAFLEEWCRAYDCDGQEKEQLNCERKAIHITVENNELFEMCGLLIRVDGVVSAFAFSSYLNDSMGVMNYEKAFSHIRGLYQYLDRECASRCFSAYKYINKESDMGLPGLAQAKKSYYPVKRVRSYQLKIK